MKHHIIPVLIVAAIAALCGCSPKKPDPKAHVLGAALALTGPQADFGLKVKNGLDMAAAKINADAGYQKVQIRYEDTLSTPKDGLSAYSKLVNVDHTRFVFGSGSYFANAVGPVADSHDALFVAVGTSLPAITKGRQHVVRYSYTVDISAKVMGEYAAKHYRNVATLAVEEEYGRIATRIFREAYQGDQRKVAFEGSFGVKDTEVRTVVQKALESQPDALFVPGYGPGMVAIIRQAKEIRPDLPIIGDVALANTSIFRAAGAAAEGAVVPAMPLDGGIAINPDAKVFLDSYSKRSKDHPDMWTSGAYEALILLDKAINKTDGTVAAVRGYLIGSQPHQSFAGPVAYTNDGESLIPMKIFVIKSGALVPAGD